MADDAARHISPEALATLEAELRELEAIGAKRVIAALATLSLQGRSGGR
jgi:hypothetical protein